MNEEITASKVRLIGADGEQIGIVNLRRALEDAENAGLDLVEIAPKADPPVCKVIDYGKFRYEQTKKLKDARKKQHNVQIKRIQLSPNIDDHDFFVKINAARKFLEHGHRVKALLMMRGRQITRKEKAEEVLARMSEELSDIAIIDGGTKMESRNSISMMLVKKK
ncbi:translation initiation factor IF-3 [bacterium]|nr:translation initiation factor IF-3 [bacterium]